MDRAIPTVIVIIVVLGVLALMARSWWKRRARDAGLQASYPVPDTDAVGLATVPALYVATTPRDQPLERLAIRGLGFRARADLTVRPDGVLLALAGERPVFIPVGAVLRLSRATWTIDRAVESDGLLLLGWRLPEAPASGATAGSPATDVDSYFRVTDPADRARLTDAIRSIAPAANFPSGTTESEA
ncbi:PH-like domain-containing protein [Glaciibacter sp. 2TAF33]|uniref:PH-like domain-containing protein n=1 Tax=Glaciibacter sp. 2TAF33 TaxID=3233015 RepID=UPI003F90F442